VRGIWGGLYCLPVFDNEEALNQAVPAAARAKLAPLTPFVHVLTHKDLHLKPFVSPLTARQTLADELTTRARGGAWFGPTAWQALGLPAPVRKLLDAGA
jgi:A/G-specific adenine glycosylase